MSDQGRTKLVYIGGKKQWGKTTTCSKILQHTHKKYPHLKFFILDNGRAGAQFTDWQNPQPKTLPKEKCVVYETAEHLELFMSEDETHAGIQRRPFHVAKGDITYHELLDFCTRRGGVSIVVDEIDTHISKNQMDEALNEICQRGAHIRGDYGWGVSFFAMARRTQNVHNLFLSQSDVFYSVRVTNANDLSILKTSMGIEETELDTIKGLDRGQVRRYDDNDLSTADNIYVIEGLSEPYPSYPVKKEEDHDQVGNGPGKGQEHDRR